MSAFTCMIPSLPKDYHRTKTQYHRLFECLDINKIVFVGPPELEECIKTDYDTGIYGDHKIEYLNEREILPFEEIKLALSKQLTEKNKVGTSSTGWYYQQFLKMKFSDYCDGEYYLCWDADTIPLRHISMFSEDGKPYFDVKSECQSRYFSTIQNLFGFSKVIEKSFVSEHMIFKKEFMHDMISEIESTSFEGQTFYEKIFSAAGSENIDLGFSEFETYGTWVAMRHTSAYKLRNWKSFRNTNFFIDISELSQEDADWLSKDYDAATFEKYQSTVPELTEFFRDPRYREKLSPQQFYQAVLESNIMGNYSNGAIESDGFIFPA